ncbi:hypothetical protein M9Y10_021572 [Tritrichomonas musculus]|uniref:SCP domain-containing protein n=1 Tax=Tritrichomonas musculus TaxID=1915356 RepID=A0ABR2KQF8_9EUKA
MSTETSTETHTTTETVDGNTVQTETTVETSVGPDGQTTRKTTTVVTTTDKDGNTTTKTDENTEVLPPGKQPRMRHHHHHTPEEKEQWRKERQERKERRLKNLIAHVDDDEEKNIQEFLRLTNEYRQQNGKDPLNLVDSISQLAKEHNDLMLTFKRGLGHDGFYDRAKKIENSKANAENCAFTSNKKDPLNALLNQFISDPPHQKNLLGDYNSIGIAIGKNSRNQWFVTQLFAKIQ